MSIAEIDAEIDLILRVRPHLRDLGDVDAADRRLARLIAQRRALGGASR